MKNSQGNKLYSVKLQTMLGLTPNIVDFEVYIVLGRESKPIKYTNKSDHNHHVLSKIYGRGLTEVWLTKQEYKRYIQSTSKKLKDDKEKHEARKNLSLKDMVNSLERDHNLFKSAVSKIGLEKEVFEMAENINAETFSLINSYADFRSLLREFKSNSKEAFAATTLCSYLIIKMAQNLNNVTKSDAYYERLSLGVFLANLGLSDEDMSLIKSTKSKHKLPKRIKKQPETLIQNIKKSGEKLHPEVIQLISQHHERPDGSGFPQRLEARHFSIFSALYVIAFEFSELLLQGNFSFESIRTAVYLMHKRYKKYDRLMNAVSQTFDAFVKLTEDLNIAVDFEKEELRRASQREEASHE